MHSTPSVVTPSTCTQPARSSCSPPSSTSLGYSPPSTRCPGLAPRSPPARSTPVTAGSPPAPIQVLPAPADLPFPHVNQVWLIERYVHGKAGTPVSAVAALGVTSLTETRATPADIATLVREHWGIESLHWLRDTVYREDTSTTHTRSGPRVMTALRNLAIGAIHLHGRRDITETTRWATRAMDRPFKILKLIS
jgi:hypothetical protein